MERNTIDLEHSSKNTIIIRRQLKHNKSTKLEKVKKNFQILRNNLGNTVILIKSINPRDNATADIIQADDLTLQIEEVMS